MAGKSNVFESLPIEVLEMIGRATQIASPDLLSGNPDIGGEKRSKHIRGFVLTLWNLADVSKACRAVFLPLWYKETSFKAVVQVLAATKTREWTVYPMIAGGWTREPLPSALPVQYHGWMQHLDVSYSMYLAGWRMLSCTRQCGDCYSCNKAFKIIPTLHSLKTLTLFVTGSLTIGHTDLSWCASGISLDFCSITDTCELWEERTRHLLNLQQVIVRRAGQPVFGVYGYRRNMSMPEFPDGLDNIQVPVYIDCDPNNHDEGVHSKIHCKPTKWVKHCDAEAYLLDVDRKMETAISRMLWARNDKGKQQEV